LDIDYRAVSGVANVKVPRGGRHLLDTLAPAFFPNAPTSRGTISLS
jgi:hypothetical protein